MAIFVITKGIQINTTQIFNEKRQKIITKPHWLIFLSSKQPILYELSHQTQLSINSQIQMQKGVNPWTGKTKTSKNTGLFNDILYKHYPSFEKPQPKSEYLEMVQLIETQRSSQHIEEYRDLFDLKSKINKMKEIIEWIDKVETKQPKTQSEEQTPINSSFVYIPIHGYNTFHEILKDCVNPSKDPLMKEESLSNLKTQLSTLEEILQLNQLIMKNIL